MDTADWNIVGYVLIALVAAGLLVVTVIVCYKLSKRSPAQGGLNEDSEGRPSAWERLRRGLPLPR